MYITVQVPEDVINKESKNISIDVKTPSARDAITYQMKLEEAPDSDRLNDYLLALELCVSAITAINGEKTPKDNKEEWIESKLGVYQVTITAQEIHASRMLGKFPRKA